MIKQSLQQLQRHLVVTLDVCHGARHVIKDGTRCSRRFVAASIAAAACYLVLVDDQIASASEPPVVTGWAETVRIYPGGVLVNAKLDTGAKTSSLHVERPTFYERDGENWVRFEFRNRRGTATVIDRPINRIAKIKEAGGSLQERPVITIGICLGNMFEAAEVTLFDRTGFNFALLLGRRFLERKALVDASRKYLLKANCEGVQFP